MGEFLAYLLLGLCILGCVGFGVLIVLFFTGKIALGWMSSVFFLPLLFGVTFIFIGGMIGGAGR